MNDNQKAPRRVCCRAMLLTVLIMAIIGASTRLEADTGSCGGQSITLPFTDVLATNIFFCTIAEAFFSGLTNGTTPTTYSPSASVPREQMAAFVTRTLDQSIKRGSRRAALRQFWTTQGAKGLGLTTVGSSPAHVQSDGADLWVANSGNNTVSRVRASDGKLLQTWTGADGANGVLVAMGKVFITGSITPLGRLYQIDPTQPAGAVTTLSAAIADSPQALAFDGQRIWVANAAGSVSIITLNPFTINNVTTGFISPIGILYDGANIWITDSGDDSLKKLNASGAILQSVSVGTEPRFPAFDGTNIWVPNVTAHSISVVRATGGQAGTVIATLSGNGLNFPFTMAFDGERILATNAGGDSVSLWKASDITPIGSFSTGADNRPQGACSDGLNFWITLRLPPSSADKLARF